jgi:serine/threonine-protein kinase RsbT
MPNEAQIPISSDFDIVAARQQGRQLALKLGFQGGDVTLIAAAISEMARNIVDHAKKGEMTFERIQNGTKNGIQIIARDDGPGIPDVNQAMQYGYSTRRGLGVGLPGAKWLMDEFDIVSKVGKGTTVTMKKWLT